MTNQSESSIESNLADWQVKGNLASHRVMHFYQNDNLSAQLSSQACRHVLWAQDIPVAQREESQKTKILKIDHANSVLELPSDRTAYSPYGFSKLQENTTLLAFNGQPFDPFSQAYALGNGYRLFSPALMRFNSPDSLSPFDRGGLNAYVYCENDPLNFTDPSGHARGAARRAIRGADQGAQWAIHVRKNKLINNQSNKITEGMHPARLKRLTADERFALETKTTLLEYEAAELLIKNGLNTHNLYEQRRELSALKTAADLASRDNIPQKADPNEWADKRRVKIMNQRRDLRARTTLSAFKIAHESEQNLLNNIRHQQKQIDKILNEIQENVWLLRIF